jgi:drug/metabolite transporter (DMT)-like permease
VKQASGGWLNGFIGVMIFSGSLPATRVAVVDFDPIFLTAMRAAIAGVLALFLLRILKAERPGHGDIASLLLVACGVVVGFPLCSALALQHITAARSLVFVGLLPLATAIFGVLRGGERLPPAFWLFATAGGLCVAGFALTHSLPTSMQGDLLMLMAVMTCGYGYAEGGRLSRHLGGWQVISWALVLSLPLTAVLSIMTQPPTWQQIGMPAWISLAYVSLFSMLIGFIFWYRGLAQDGIAAVSQLQLLQPFLGMLLAAVLLHEPIEAGMLGTAVAVVACVIGARRHSGSGAAPLD